MLPITGEWFGWFYLNRVANSRKPPDFLAGGGTTGLGLDNRGLLR
jgi:hypothetical protein